MRDMIDVSLEMGGGGRGEGVGGAGVDRNRRGRNELLHLIESFRGTERLIVIRREIQIGRPVFRIFGRQRMVMRIKVGKPVFVGFGFLEAIRAMESRSRW